MDKRQANFDQGSREAKVDGQVVVRTQLLDSKTDPKFLR